MDAARKAEGVKLFVPSEFGNVTDEREGRDEGDFKGAVRAYLRGVGLPFVAIFVRLSLSVPIYPANEMGYVWCSATASSPPSPGSSSPTKANSIS